MALVLGRGGRSTSLAELAIVCLEGAIVWLQLEHSMVTNEAIVWPQTGHSMAKGDHSMVIFRHPFGHSMADLGHTMAKVGHTMTKFRP